MKQGLRKRTTGLFLASSRVLLDREERFLQCWPPLRHPPPRWRGCKGGGHEERVSLDVVRHSICPHCLFPRWPPSTERLHLVLIFKMVVVYVEAPSASHTVYFDKPLESPRFVSLISATIHNSWRNLDIPAHISCTKDEKVYRSAELAPGRYTPDSLSRAMEETFDLQFRIKARS